MAELRNNVTSEILTYAVESCDRTMGVNQVVNFARDGSLYIQNLGTAKVEYTVVCVGDRNFKDKIEQCYESGTELSVKTQADGLAGVSRINLYCFGYITNLSHETYSGVFDGAYCKDYFKFTLTLAKSRAETIEVV